jgi:hypothetical protein
MPSDDAPVHVGTLEQSGVVDTPDGPKLKLETDQGAFLLTADAKTPVDQLSMALDLYLGDVMRGETDAE